MSFLTKLPKERYSKTAFGQFRCDREFDLGTGKAMAWMSQLAYETDEPGKIREILAQWGMQLLGVVSGTIRTALPIARTHGFIAGGRGAVIVAFAGTDPLVLANWVTDFNARINDDGIAEGYATAAAVVWDQLRSMIGNGARGEVFAAGHSLGGALAALTAYRLDSEDVADICAVYTFGMPRSGNVSFASRYNERLGSRTYRIVHGDDIVPTLAPSSLGFRHVGRYLHCDRGAAFQGLGLTQAVDSDEPMFTPAIMKEIVSWSDKPVPNIISIARRYKLAAALATGWGPAGMRTDPGGIAIELLPPRLRDHMPDRYISGFK
jgi:triacylglycerol lipase